MKVGCSALRPGDALRPCRIGAFRLHARPRGCLENTSWPTWRPSPGPVAFEAAEYNAGIRLALKAANAAGGVLADNSCLLCNTVPYGRKFPFSLIAVIVLFLLTTVLFGEGNVTLSRFEGILLLLLFAGFLFYVFKQLKSDLTI